MTSNNDMGQAYGTTFLRNQKEQTRESMLDTAINVVPKLSYHRDAEGTLVLMVPYESPNGQ
jgi:hypothetical protein